MLDLESVRLFVLAAEFGNLTRAAEAAGTVQPVVSQRIKTLETVLGRRLLERTPRLVRLTEEGAAFLPRARTLLATHDAAVRFADQPTVRFALGASDHALGLTAETVLAKVRAALPAGAVIEVRMGMSHDVRKAFDAGDLDAVVVRREGSAVEGERLGADPLGWRAAPGWSLVAGAPLALATMGPPCGVRAAAIRALDHARIPWRETFVAGSCAALLAGVRAGLGVAPMGEVASGGLTDCGPEHRLPVLPASEIALFARAGSPPVAAAVRALGAAVRAALSRTSPGGRDRAGRARRGTS